VQRFRALRYLGDLLLGRLDLAVQARHDRLDAGLQASVVGAFRRLVSCTRIEISSSRRRASWRSFFSSGAGKTKGCRRATLATAKSARAFASIASVLA